MSRGWRVCRQGLLGRNAEGYSVRFRTTEGPFADECAVRRQFTACSSMAHVVRVPRSERR